MNKKYIRNFVTILLIGILITACFPGGGSSGVDDPAGFFSGIWHGWIAPISLIMGFFNRTISIYEIHNTGWWYDLGFYIAIISGFGGLSFFRKDRDKN